MKLAIIGAGAAGLAAAHKLRHVQPAIQTVIYEKSRGVGGRAATRRTHGAVFDHGAQYVKAPTPALERLLSDTLAHDTLVTIDAPVWTFDSANTIQEGDQKQNRDGQWTYSDGVTRLAKELARDLDVRTGVRVGRIAQAARSFILFDTDGNTVGAADAVLLTPPAPQTADLIQGSALPAAAQHTMLEQLAQVRYRRCLTLTLGYDAVLQERPWYALVNTDKKHPLSWLAYEHRKPQRPMDGQHVVIAQMAPQWSVDHWDDDLPMLQDQITALLTDLLDENLRTPRWTDRQGWRYSQPDSAADFRILNDALPGVFFAGDYTAGQGRVHLAIEQGWKAADQIAAYAASLEITSS
jgi:hypothetical protein